MTNNRTLSQVIIKRYFHQVLDIFDQVELLKLLFYRKSNYIIGIHSQNTTFIWQLQVNQKMEKQNLKLHICGRPLKNSPALEPVGNGT